MTTTVTCLMCRGDTTLQIPDDEWEAWQKFPRAHIQNAIPSLDAGQRELLISQTCEACFTKLFKDEDNSL